jgi:hypothetical protein
LRPAELPDRSDALHSVPPNGNGDSAPRRATAPAWRRVLGAAWGVIARGSMQRRMLAGFLVAATLTLAVGLAGLIQIRAVRDLLTERTLVNAEARDRTVRLGLAFGAVRDTANDYSVGRYDPASKPEFTAAGPKPAPSWRNWRDGCGHQRSAPSSSRSSPGTGRSPNRAPP